MMQKKLGKKQQVEELNLIFEPKVEKDADGEV